MLLNVVKCCVLELRKQQNPHMCVNWLLLLLCVRACVRVCACVCACVCVCDYGSYTFDHEYVISYNKLTRRLLMPLLVT